MSKHKIYICGPMTGKENLNKDAFSEAEDRLRNDGHVVLNPSILPPGLEQNEYMDICIAMVRCCSALFCLEGWEDSFGAVAEHAYASKLQLKIIYQNRG